ncbi:alpha/beta hydrolase [Marinicella sp. W31]|uniref:alpha/beta hydrolase n=1 Tax=Marinicella sp. W31 TaxID=3023713 RepID=UPI003757B9BB
MSLLETITVATGDNPKLSVIWLHGLGADGHDFEPVVPLFKNPDTDIRFVFPHAPVRPVTINGGMSMRAWYDIKMMDIGKQPDETGIRESAVQVEALIEAEIKAGFDSQQIILAGFSQGGAIALHTGLRLKHQLGGIVALSCYLTIADKLAAEKTEANQNTPIFMAHGTYDPVVPYQLGHDGHQQLKQHGYAVNWHEYPIQHGVSPEELEDIKSWILKQASS